MAQPYVLRGSVILSAAPILFGLNGMFRPEAHLRSLQLPLHAEPEARKLDYMNRADTTFPEEVCPIVENPALTIVELLLIESSAHAVWLEGIIRRRWRAEQSFLEDVDMRLKPREAIRA